MRHLVMVVAFLGCDSKNVKVPVPSSPEPSRVIATPKLALPVVNGGTALPSDPPPVLIMIDPAGNLRIAALKTWNSIPTLDAATSKPADLDELRKSLTAAEESHAGPSKMVALYGNRAQGTGAVAGSDEADDEAAGPTGVQLALDESEHGKASSPPSPHSAAAGPLGPLGGAFGDAKRNAVIAGELNDSASHPAAVLLADPHSKVTRSIEVLLATGGVLGVLRDGAVVPLKLQIERVSTRVENEPSALDVRVHAASIDPDLAAVKVAMTKRDPWNPIDLLVDPDVDAQRLVDVIVQFDQAGAHVLGLGAAK